MPKIRGRKRKHRHKWVHTGKIYCSDCKVCLPIPGKKRNYHYYKRIRTPKLREQTRIHNLNYRKTKKYKIANKKWYERDAKRVKYRTMVSVILRRGLKLGLIKRKPCEVCGIKKAEAHHPSYFKKDALKVMWLCKIHHEQWHMTNNQRYPN